ncbi:transposable element Tc3 transposase [Trichonephila clavipes]|nr:transposable element Tc3 transposase [Trichonephila clavipes]
MNWPPRSCDLTPLEYFLWGCVKSLVYADKPQTRHHLEDNIRRVIADIRPQMLEKVIENWTSRLDYIRASRGSPMPEIIIKIVIITVRTYLDDFLRGKIIGLLECCRSQLEVSEELGITQSVISRPWQRFQDDGNFPCRSCGGGVAIDHPLEEFRRAKSYCHLYGAQGQRQVYL